MGKKKEKDLKRARKVVFALDELLDIKGHGDIYELARTLGIHRETLKGYVENTCKLIRMRHLSTLCDYALANSSVDASMLPAALFKYLPDDIWPMLTERDSVEIGMGMRMGESFKDPLVALADSVLKDCITDGMNSRTKNSPAGREHYILAPDRNGTITSETKRRVKEIYSAFHRRKAKKALVCLGSMKSNPLIEHVLSGYLKKGKPFSSEDGVESPKQRSSPIYFLYREKDPTAPSAWGGRRLSSEIEGEGPGIHYEDKFGEWQYCPCNDDEDAALVFYRVCNSTNESELILGGFSSYASHALAWLLRKDQLYRQWEPVYSHQGVQIGAYVIRFTKADNDTSYAPDFTPPKHFEVIALDKDVVRRRFRVRPAKSRTSK